MDPKLSRRGLLAAGLALPLFAGCGSGSTGAGGTENAANGTRGTLNLTLNIPPARTAGTPAKSRAFGGYIPLGTQSVMVTVKTGATGTVLATALRVTDQSVGTNTSQGFLVLGFSDLPVGQVFVQAQALPDREGKLPPLATAEATTQITAGTTTNITMPLALTLTTFTVSPPVVTISPVQTAQNHTAILTATVRDAMNRDLQLPVYWVSENPGVAQVAFDPNNPTTATITGVSAGTTNVTVVEPNSGMTASVQAISFES